jgi:hypothetical protein
MKKIISLVCTLCLILTQSAFAAKTLNLDQKLLDFEGKPIKEGTDKDSSELTLKRMLLFYLMQSNQMTLTQDEMISAYEAGVFIGSKSGVVEIPQNLYDTIKKISDNPKVKDRQGQETSIQSIVITGQVKKIIDGAENK